MTWDKQMLTYAVVMLSCKPCPSYFIFYALDEF